MAFCWKGETEYEMMPRWVGPPMSPHQPICLWWLLVRADVEGEVCGEGVLRWASKAAVCGSANSRSGVCEAIATGQMLGVRD